MTTVERALSLWGQLLCAMAVAYPQPQIAAAHLLLRRRSDGNGGSRAANAAVVSAAANRAVAGRGGGGIPRRVPGASSAAMAASASAAGALQQSLASQSATATTGTPRGPSADEAAAALRRRMEAHAASDATASAAWAMMERAQSGTAGGYVEDPSAGRCGGSAEASASGPASRQRGGSGHDGRVRTWDLQEMVELEAAWQPQKALREAAALEEAALRATAAARAVRPPTEPIGSAGDGRKGEGGGATRMPPPPVRSAGRKLSATQPSRGQPTDAQVAAGGARAAGRAPPPGGGKAAVKASGGGSGGGDELSRLLSGQFVDVTATAAPTLAPAARPAPATSMPRPTAAAPDSVAERRAREQRATDCVHRLHAAAAMDTALPASGACLRLLPLLGSTVRDPRMAVPLLRAGMLGAIRRVLQVTGDERLVAAAQAERVRHALFGILRTLTPSVQAAHLRTSRGLGKLLMLIARSPSERRPVREAAAQVLQALVTESSPAPAPAPPTRPPPGGGSVHQVGLTRCCRPEGSATAEAATAGGGSERGAQPSDGLERSRRRREGGEQRARESTGEHSAKRVRFEAAPVATAAAHHRRAS